MGSATDKTTAPASGQGVSLEVRLEPDLLAKIDQWISEQPQAMSRAEAVQTLLLEALDEETWQSQN